jgi:hypothetical protein
MARSRDSRARHETGKTITSKSQFGSHAEMVVDHTQYGLTLEDGQVLLQDGGHFYVTKSNRLDDGTADPARYSGKKLYLESGGDL